MKQSDREREREREKSQIVESITKATIGDPLVFDQIVIREKTKKKKN